MILLYSVIQEPSILTGEAAGRVFSSLCSMASQIKMPGYFENGDRDRVLL